MGTVGWRLACCQWRVHCQWQRGLNPTTQPRPRVAHTARRSVLGTAPQGGWVVGPWGSSRGWRPDEPAAGTRSRAMAPCGEGGRGRRGHSSCLKWGCGVCCCWCQGRGTAATRSARQGLGSMAGWPGWGLLEPPRAASSGWGPGGSWGRGRRRGRWAARGGAGTVGCPALPSPTQSKPGRLRQLGRRWRQPPPRSPLRLRCCHRGAPTPPARGVRLCCPHVGGLGKGGHRP